MIENDVVEQSHDSLNEGVGIRLLKKLQCVYGYTCDLSKKGLLKLAKDLSSSFQTNQTVFVKDLKVKKYKTINPIKIDYDCVSREEKIALIRLGLDATKDYDPRIIRRQGSFTNNHRNVVIYNSKGEIIKTSTQYGRLLFMILASDGKSLEYGFEGPGCQDDINYFKEKIDVKKIALNAARVAIQNLEAKECPSGVMPVVLGNGWGGVLFHESCGHPLEASSVLTTVCHIPFL